MTTGTAEAASRPPVADELLLLAMDHRDSLVRDVYGITGEPSVTDDERIAAGKQLVFDGLLAALRGGVDPSGIGVLVDERFGAAVATQAHELGLTLAMPIERSGQRVFTLEYGSVTQRSWLEHLDRFTPDHVKVLVRDNPDADPRDRRIQFDRLAAVSAALRDTARSFLFELLVPATDAQLESVAGDTMRYDTDLRPDLTVRVIADMQAAGVEPHIWKVEGLETTDAAAQVVEAARSGGRQDVRCVVLGRDAPPERLDTWLRVAAVTDGFCGFAIGRSIWERPLSEHVTGRITTEQAIEQVMGNWMHYLDTYRATRHDPAGH